MAPKSSHGTLDERVGAITSHIVRRLADAAVEDMRARYDLGRVLHTLRRAEPGGNQAGIVRRMAERLDVDPSALRRCAQVGEAIPPREFAWMTRLANGRGEPLTWSHVEWLARVRDPERRKELAQAVVHQALSVRQLAAMVRRES